MTVCRLDTGWNRYTVTWVRLSFSEGHESWYLASRMSLAARRSRAGPGSGRLRPARCDPVPVLAGTPSHRAGDRAGSATPKRAADGTAEAEAGDEAPGNRRPGRMLI